MFKKEKNIMQNTLPKENIKKYALSGKAQITLFNEKTQNKVSMSFKRGKGKYSNIVHVRSEENRYIGFFSVENGEPNDLKTTYKTTLEEDSREVLTAKWIVSKMRTEDYPDFIKVGHNGQCSKCGRELTDPESVKQGFGPICRKKMGI